MKMNELEKALHEVVYNNFEARKDITNKEACDRCKSAMDRVMELSPQSITKVYQTMHEKGKGKQIGCTECVDVYTFSLAYLLLLEMGRIYSEDFALKI